MPPSEFLHDVDRDTELSHKETMQMINVLLFVTKENRDSQQYEAPRFWVAQESEWGTLQRH
ncbi:ubiquitin carboxyl-terminal hydrolase 32-like [Drosophila miranda]|uniref:ubiquitin carboxyl-terminal hydrolase 32-like n=1 Tax=Drosophila miranda TaxID=7229 RepID=UPI00143F31F1|nr:ubiquitin carboxyl-terminal hydrolase 32-like [Drosophila miranda]XP_033254377.1 ubiquitin carboxyl-terminal hydrolase 32-like [Drosophila miranda]